MISPFIGQPQSYWAGPRIFQCLASRLIGDTSEENRDLVLASARRIFLDSHKEVEVGCVQFTAAAGQNRPSPPALGLSPYEKTEVNFDVPVHFHFYKGGNPTSHAYFPTKWLSVRAAAAVKDERSPYRHQELGVDLMEDGGRIYVHPSQEDILHRALEGGFTHLAVAVG